MIRKAAAFSLLLVLFLFAVPVSATDGGYGTTTTIPRCEYNPNHPFCQTTTTTEVEETTTTAPIVNTTTTVSIPFDSVPTTVPDVQVSSTVVTAAPVVEELPFTGMSSSMLAAASSFFLLAGLAVLGLRRRETD